MTDPTDELKHIVEAALFANETPLSVARLIGLFPKDATPAREDIKTVLAQLEGEYADRGIELKRVGKAYRFQSREKYATWLRKLNEGRPPRYTRALLETLAIIAYRQPVTRGDIEEIRGVSVSTETMRTLLNREWIRQLGQREVPGRPDLFGTTPHFLAYFNLGSLSDLPALTEKREPAEIADELNLRLPLEETGGEQAGEGDVDDDAAVDPPARPTAEIIHLDTPGESVSTGDDEH